MSKYHFNIKFYSDSLFNNLVKTFSSKDIPEQFVVNGSVMDGSGIEIEDGTCASVDFKFSSSNNEFLDKIFYIKIEPVLASISDKSTDVIFIVDESQTMGPVHASLDDILFELEDILVAHGIGPNRYGIVGFGGDGDKEVAHRYAIGGSEFGTAIQARNFITGGGLVKNGIRSDGYDGIAVAMSRYTFTKGNIPSFILVTNNDRDIVDDGITKDDIVQNILNGCAGKYSLSSFLNVNLSDDNGQQAIGIDGDDNAYIANGSNVEVSSGGEVLSTIGNIEQDYVALTIATKGNVWDINAMNTFSKRSAFAKAFSKIKIAQMNNAFITVNPQTTTFFCSSNRRTAVSVPITVLNSSSSNFGVGSDAGYHFRVTFYNNSDKQQVINTAFSLLDQKKWFVEGDIPSRITTNGVLIRQDESKTVFYIPDVLTLDQYHTQRKRSISEVSSETDRPLICGINYYVETEVYVNNNLLLHDKFTYSAPCTTVPSSKWREDEDSNSWISSGQDKDDIRITSISNHTIKPHVVSNLFGQFFIVWEDHRNSDSDIKFIDYKPQIYMGIWDSIDDIFYASGQGRADVRLLDNDTNPKIIADFAQNMYVAGRSIDKIHSYKCRYVPVETIIDENAKLISINKFFGIDGTNRDIDQYLKAIIYEPDITGSYIIAGNKTIPVVDDCIIRLDVVGLPGTYAVRLRNEIDFEWSGWINVGTEIKNITQQDDIEETGLLSAFLVDNERFIVPWVLSPGSGIKNVCLQVLTFFGVSKTFCLELFSNIEEMEYDVEFFEDAGLTIPLKIFNGQPVASTLSNKESIIYIKVTFKEIDKLKLYRNKISTLKRYSHLLDHEFTFNIIQQGVNDQFDLPLQLVANKTNVYTGQFIIKRNDGVLNKDGLGAVVVNIPNPCTRVTRSPKNIDILDPFNPMTIGLMQDFYVNYGTAAISLSPQSLLEVYKKSHIAKTIDINRLKTSYDVHDPRFVFGNPDYFNK